MSSPINPRLACLVSLWLGLALVALPGCGNDLVPSVSATSPLKAFRGRTVDVHLAGSATVWDSSTTVDFGPDITVNQVTAASATALVVNITIAPTAELGPRTIVVNQGDTLEPYEMAFSVESAIDVQVQGTPAQGSLVFLTIVNKDLETVFDDTSSGGGLFSAPTFTNIEIKGGTGIAVNVDNVTPFRVEATVLIDVMATAGQFDLDLASGPVDGDRASFVYPALFDVASRTAETLMPSATVNIDKPFESSLFTLTPGGADHQVTISVSADSETASPSVVVLEKSGSFKDVVNSGDTVSFIASGTNPVYVIVYDGGGEGGYAIDVTSDDVALAIQAGGEGNDSSNDMSNGAVVLMSPPVIVKGASLSSKDDADWYKVTVPAGKRIHAKTLPGDASTDTTLQFFGTDGSTPLAKPVDSDYHEDSTSPAVSSAGDYYIKVGASDAFDDSAKKYDLLVTLE